MSTKEARLDQQQKPALDAPERLMQRLLEFPNAGAPVISLYLDTRAIANRGNPSTLSTLSILSIQ